MQLKIHTVTIEDLVPGDHFLRKLEKALDLSFVYDETRKLYSHRCGRPPIDPIVLVKYLLVGYLYGIPSERQIEQRIQTDVALRWYLGLDLFERVPDHSTISQLRRRKPSFRKIFRQLFEAVVEQCVQAGLVSGRLVVTDSTHVKANASRASEHLVEVTGKPGAYWERLDAYEEEGLEELERRIPERKTGKKRRQKKRTKPVKGDSRYTRKWISRTAPESGHLNRPGKPQGPHYLSHETVDCEHGIILETAATSGAAYDLPLSYWVLREHNIRFYVRPMPRSAAVCGTRPNEPFSYDPEKDSYTCPNGKELQLRNLTRSSGGLHWAYFSNKTDCEACPCKTRCIGSRRAKVVERNYFWKEMKQDFSELDSPAYQKALRKRQIWSEGTFAAQKWGHNLARVLRRGLEAAEDHCLLSATALNLKRMIKWTV